MALTIANCHSVTRIDWQRIDTVLLDMDGTLLDLRFDNEFWLQAVPQEYALRQGTSIEAALKFLTPIFEGEAGKLNWYCLDFWSSTLGFDVADLKRRLSHGINWRPEARDFLDRLRTSHCDTVLITNAHPETLRIKLEQVNLTPWFDRMISSHDLQAPKESPAFWSALAHSHPFDPARTLFIDDSETVLQAAERAGVAHLITLRQPDSTGPVRRDTRYPAIHHFSEITAGLTSSE